MPHKNEIFVYRAYGLNIHSPFAFPELVPSSGKVDVTIRYGTVNSVSAKGGIQVTPSAIHISWPSVGAFLLRDGCEIIFDPNPEANERLLRAYLLGAVLGILLHQRREMVAIHASVVAISKQAVAFAGVKGAGKSTMAATLHSRGHQLVADDILVADLNRNVPVAFSGIPRFKLWPDSARTLGLDPLDLPRLSPELEKRGRSISSGFATDSVPLKRFYFLASGEKPEIHPLNFKEALTEMLPHWYGATLGMAVVNELGVINHFTDCTNLAKSVKVCRLSRPLSLEALPDVARLVEDDLAN